MWTLECDGPLFDGKKLWLRPGTSHLFGRTKQPTLRHTKSVSKKHLKISVSAVKAGTGSQLHTRTEIILEDFSKLGTTVNGSKISQATKILVDSEHVIQVAKYEHLLRIKWKPVVLTFAHLSKDQKKLADPLTTYREKLETLDIKFTKDFVQGQTTHVVASKRNIPTVLQGICSAKYIVTEDYVEAIVHATTEEPSEDGEGEPKAPLERDYEAFWPDPMQYVPAVANEPVKREASFLRPKPERSEVFYGYTFVFCLKASFEQLQPPLNAGGGKALLWEPFQAGKSDPQDFAAFVKNVAGEKGVGELEQEEGKKGVVVVRIVAKGQDDWATRWVQETDKILNQRSIEQNEFLDAILLCDASGMRKRLQTDIVSSSGQVVRSVGSSRPSTRSKPEPMEEVQQETSRSSTAELLSQRKKVTRRPVTQSRFKGFDDFDDEPEPTPAQSFEQTHNNDIQMDDSTRPAKHRNMQNLIVAAEKNPRKRPTPEPDNVTMDSILPAAAAMKKRRLNGEQPVPVPAPEPVKATRRPKKENEIDVLEEVRKQREAEEQKEREDAEKLKNAMEDMEIEGPARLVEVDEMPLHRPASSVAASRTSTGSGRHWDERWNGRPDFKRFRRRGGEDRPERPRRSERVIVAVVEVKKKDFGIGDEYWLEPRTSKKTSQSQRETQVSQTLRAQAAEEEEGAPIIIPSSSNSDDEEEDETSFPRPRHNTKNQPTATRQSQSQTQLVPNTVSSQTQRSSATRPLASSTMSSRKRPAPGTGGSVRKKSKPAWTRDETDDDEEEDEAAFPSARRSVRR